MFTIAVDAMGGDDAPEAVVAGAAQASLSTSGQIALVGDEAAISRTLDGERHDASRIRVIGAVGSIPMDARPRAALDDLPEASLPAAARLVAAGEANALVSAGNSGAVILACADSFCRIEGIKRTALASVVPTERRRGANNDPFTLLLDVGATVRVDADDLVSFALMGSAYASVVSRHDRPRVALLSNGTESNKGTDAIIEAHARLRDHATVNFIGNVEGIDIPKGVADVIVCDGFTGNVVLKMLEGVSETVVNLARYAYKRRLAWRVAMTLLSGGISQLKSLTDWQQYGGAPVLGFDNLCIKAHGRSGPRAIRNAIKVASKCVEQDLAGRIRVGV